MVSLAPSPVPVTGPAADTRLMIPDAGGGGRHCVPPRNPGAASICILTAGAVFHSLLQPVNSYCRSGARRSSAQQMIRMAVVLLMKVIQRSGGTRGAPVRGSRGNMKQRLAFMHQWQSRRTDQYPGQTTSDGLF